MLFFDTSALVKRYAIEPGTGIVDRLIDDGDRTIVVTSLSVIEITSAFRRKQNKGELTARQRDDLLVAFFEEATDSFALVPLDEAGFVRAFDLVLEDDLRTLDSLQLGAAIELSGGDNDLTFVSADENLVEVAKDRGVMTVNPVAQETR